MAASDSTSDERVDAPKQTSSMVMIESMQQQSPPPGSRHADERDWYAQPHMTLTEYAQRRRLHQHRYELSQPLPFNRSSFATTLNEDHKEQFVTLARYIQLKCLSSEWVEMDKSVSSSADSQDDSPIHPFQQLTGSSPEEDQIRLISRADRMRQRFMRQKVCSVYASTSSSSIEQLQDDTTTQNAQHITSSVSREDKALLTLAEYAHRRRLRHEQRATDDAGMMVSTPGESMSSSCENLRRWDERLANRVKQSSELHSIQQDATKEETSS